MADTLTLKRINVNSSTLPKYGLTDTRSKKASGFIQDIQTTGDFYRQPFIKLSSHDAFKLYEFNEWVNAVVNRIVEDCVKVKPLITGLDKTKKMTPARQRRIDIVTDFIGKPNNNKETFSQLRYKYLKDHLIFGHGAYEKVVDPDSRRLLELHSLQSQFIEIQSDDRGNLVPKNTYKLLVGNFRGRSKARRRTEIQFDKDEVIFSVMSPQSGSHYGIKPLDTLANSVASDLLRAAYNSNFFINGSESSGIISVEGMSRTELRRFRQYWESQFKGAKNGHKIAAVNVPVEFVRMAMTNRDMQFGEYGIELRSKIFAVYGMQPVIMGITEGGGGPIKSKDEAIKCYKNAAIKPLLRKETERYNMEIIRDGFGFDDIGFDFGAIDDLDLETQSKIDEIDLRTGVRVINEVRKTRQMSEVPWGDNPLVLTPGGGQVDDEGNLIPPREQPTNKPNSGKKPNDDKKPNSGSNSSKDITMFTMYSKCLTSYTMDLYDSVDSVDSDVFNVKFGDFDQSFICENFKTLQGALLSVSLYREIEKIFSENFSGSKALLKQRIDYFVKELKRSEIFEELENGV